MAFANLASGTLYLALGTSFSAAGIFTEQTGSGYARAVTPALYDPTANVIAFPTGTTFAATGTWTASTYLALFDAPSGGNMLMVWPFAGTALTSGTTQTIAAAANNIALNSAVLAAGKATSALTAVGTVTATGGTVTGGVPLTITSAGVLSASGASYTPLAQPSINFRDLLDGGDMTVNPFQRNIAGLATSGVCTATASSTPVYFADRWFAMGGASSSITQALVASTAAAGYNQALQWGRTAANTNTAAIYLGHVLETADCIRVQGQQLTLAFTALLGAAYSGGQVTAQVITGTGVNQSAAALVAGTWTGQAVAFSQSFTLSTTASRYQLTGIIPVNATQIGVLFSYTPSGTAGATDNVLWFDMDMSPGYPASPAERRDVQVELEICQRYAWVQAEPANGVILGAGSTTVANSQTFVMGTPVQLRAAPTVTVVTGGFKVAAGAAAATGTITAGTTHTPNQVSVNSAVTAAAGVGALLQGGGGAGYILTSADF